VDFVALDENLRESFRILASGRDSGEVRSFHGLFITHAGVTFQMFNAAFLSSPVADETDLARRIAQAGVYFSARGTQWSFWVTSGWLSEPLRRRSRSIFQRYRLRHVSEMPGMIAETVPPPERPMPAIDIRRVTNAALRDTFCELGSTCFNVPPTWFREVFETETIWNDFRGYVGFVNGVPVATAALVVTPGALGVYNVATIPPYQRRGYGEAIMRGAMEDARREAPFERTILQSTAQGLSLYLRMGYRSVTKVDVYAS
jgi:ribosomal protein S18 acetylase RimI-like enzyme